jgi:hypothetical protein
MSSSRVANSTASSQRNARRTPTRTISGYPGSEETYRNKANGFFVMVVFASKMADKSRQYFIYFYVIDTQKVITKDQYLNRGSLHVSEVICTKFSISEGIV